MAATKKKTELSYSQASEELETILDEIETGTADVDVLSEKVERAAQLIKHCRETLSGTELRVQKVVEELAANDDGSDQKGETSEGGDA